MPETLVIKLPADVANGVSWITVDEMGAVTGEAGHGPLESAAAATAGRAVTALLPSSAVLRVYSNIPLKGHSKILQALPFALEEQLAQDVETLHFAIGERNSDKLLPVAVVESGQLEDYLSQLNAGGLYPTAVYAESDAVIPVPATTVLWLNDDELIIREPDGSSSVADPEELETLLQLKFPLDSEADDNAQSHVLVYCTAQANTDHAEIWDQLRGRVPSLDIKIISNGGIGKLASGIVSNPGINLLQGEFAARTDLFSWWPLWRVAAGLLVAVCLLSLATDALAVWQLSRQEAKLNAVASETLVNAFPSAAGAADPWGQLQSRLQAGSGGATNTGPDFVEALVVLAKALDSSSGIKVEALNFRAGIIDLRLEAPAVQNLDTLRQTINDSGVFVADIQSANPADNVIKGRVQVKVKGT
jgi:general secretion pathway protein L